jgi:hypothetical protein
VTARSRRSTPAALLISAVLGAAAIMISPVTPWTMAVALCGATLLVAAAGILAVWLLRHW